MEFLSHIYNTFISLLSRVPKEYLLKKLQIKESLQIIGDQNINSEYVSLYRALFAWKGFINIYIDPYCFDLKIKLENKNGIVSFIRSSKDYYKWELDGKRYEINRLNYKYESINTIKSEFDFMSEKLLGSELENDYEINCQLDYIALDKFLNDVKLVKFPGGNGLDSSRFYQPLISASNYFKLVYSTFDSVCGSNQDYFKALDVLKKDYLQLYEKNNFPMICSTIKEFYNRYDAESKKERDAKTKKEILLNPFSYTIKFGGSINRFQLNYNVFKKPFLKIQDCIFAPTLFLAKQDWFYSFTQNVLERLDNRYNRKLRKESSDKMEMGLKELFQKVGFKVQIHKHNTFTDKEGDVDLEVTDGEAIILIQLKRTKLRPTLKEAYFELVNTDKKASRQINNIEDNFRNSNKKIVKWIVTTSFENVYTYFDGCFKVNYFDLIEVLKSYSLMSEVNVSIEDLNENIIKDFQIKELIDLKGFMDTENKEVLKLLRPCEELYWLYKNVNIPISVKDPKEYREIVFNMIRGARSENLLIESKKLYEEGNSGQASKLLKTYLKSHPEDFDTLGNLANILADMKCFDQSIHYYKKALNVAPDDLFLSLNYIRTLREFGKNKEANSIQKKIEQIYWFVDFRIPQ